MGKTVFILGVFFYLFITVVLIVPQKSYAQQVSIPNITPFWIKRVPYTTQTGLVLSKSKSGSSQDTSPFSPKNLLTSIPSSVGGLAIVAGSIFAWIRVKGKGKTFKKYLAKIESVEKAYEESKGETKQSAQKALKIMKETLTNLQNEIDLAAADKKIDEEQRTTLFHDLDRKLAQTA